MRMIADGNIAHLSDFFNEATLGRPVEVIAMAGREINAAAIEAYQPDVLLVRSVTRVNAELLGNNKSVKFVGSATIGIDHIDVEYLSRHGVVFANAAGCSRHSVAQYVIAAITELRPDYIFKPITLGIIGVGNIGITLAQYAVALGWNVLGYDPLKPPSAVNNSRLETVLRESDVVSFHVPLTSPKQSSYPTHHDYLMTKERWQILSDTAIVINTSRGAVLGRDNIVASPNVTVLDVFENEPTIDRTLLQAASIVTPHIAGYTLEGKLRGTQMVYDALCKFLNIPKVMDFHHFLPPVIPLFNTLHNPLNEHDRHQLLKKMPQMYDIRADDKRLRGVANADGDIVGKDFDALRKNYPLRREWQAYIFEI